MVLFATTSCTNYAIQPWSLVLRFIKNIICQITSNLVLSFLRVKVFWFPRILAMIISLLRLTYYRGNVVTIVFVGARQERNCKNYTFLGIMMTKKNTQVWCLGVLCVVCYYVDVTGPIVAPCTNLIKQFVRRYV